MLAGDEQGVNSAFSFKKFQQRLVIVQYFFINIIQTSVVWIQKTLVIQGILSFYSLF